jgi:bifunctional UDP-N-acetylglucosamine pyrophosphorylase/glucosamine-1-phosphate N-acetyltransferase
MSAHASPERTTAVILAAGKGTRMKSDRPKVLHEICGRPMLRFVVEAARGAGADRIVVVVGHDRDRIRDAVGDDDLVWVVQEPQLGTGDALAAAREALGEARGTIALLYGDVPLVRPETIRSLLETHRREGNDMTILAGVLEDPSHYGRVIRDAGGRVACIREEIDADERERAIREVNTGLYGFEAPAVFDVLSRLERNEKKGEIFLTDAAEAIASRGGKVGSVPIADPSEVIGVNDRRGLARAASVLRERILDRLMRSGVTVVDPATTYVDADVEIGRDTVIHPCTVIRAGVRVGRCCEIGPFTHLRVGTRMDDRSEVGNFTEVKKTSIGEGSKAKHLTYLGDAVIGRGANIGAGTITANYDGVRKSVSKIGDGAFIGSGTVIVAPAEVARGGITGAGAIVTRGSRVGEGEVYVGVPARKLETTRRREGEA